MTDLFTPIIHEKENNRESENMLNENRKHFSEQCKKVLGLLLRGDRLTVYDALVVHGISSLPRRCLDLIENGVDVQRTYISSTRVKEFWLRPEEIERVKKLTDLCS